MSASLARKLPEPQKGSKTRENVAPGEKSLYYKNVGLFSDPYLEALPKTRGDSFILKNWDTFDLPEFNECYEWMLSTWDELKDILPKLSEDQLRAKWIDPILQRLGWEYQVEEKVQRWGKSQRPDYSLFESQSAWKKAQGCPNRDEGYFKHVSAIGEAKEMGVPLDAAKLNNTNPSFQIIAYLVATGKEWGILTDGRYWRLYSTKSKSSFRAYYEINVEKFRFKHIAVMPDVHLGKGATIGSVLATKGAVIPAAVGVDIGCGVMALKLKIEADEILNKTDKIRQSIESSIPLGPKGNREITTTVENWFGWKTWEDLYATQHHPRTAHSLLNKAKNQLGSLGGGNHFIELCTDTEGHVWVMLHSGSRNIGKSLAEIHIDHAKVEMKRLLIKLPDPELAYYLEGTKGYAEYMHDILWAQNYAEQNRKEMMFKILKDIRYALGMKETPLETELEVNCHHNYASFEHHYGEEVLVTRKGALRARKGELGIIPGSMGTRSYIVTGLGNEDSFHSCSHGAGRRMSRGEAKRRFTLEDFVQQTKGVHCRKDRGVLDEIPGAYKDIDKVMENQKDLVQVVAQLKQFLCVKG